MSSQTIRIAIAGGGITGLAFAISLAKTGANVDVDVYESAPSFSEIGAGIGFSPRILEDLRFLGFAADIESRGLEARHLVFRKGDEPDCKAWGESVEPIQTLHRAEFLDVLLNHLPANYRTHFGKRLTSYTDSKSEPVVLSFKDGITATCDLLVGADGIKSATRKSMYEKLADAEPSIKDATVFRDLIQPKWTGKYVYRSVIPREKLVEICPNHPSLDVPQAYCGKRKVMITYPISQGRLINCAAMNLHSEKTGTVHDEPWVAVAPQAEVKDLFVGWSSYVQNLADLFVEPSRWVLNVVSELPTYASSRVAIIGDAAHAMTPHLGSGAAQGIEDGLLLATLLAQPQASLDQVPTILNVYDEIRRPFSQEVARKSENVGTLQVLGNEELKGYSEEASAAGQIPAVALARVLESITSDSVWTWTTSARDDRARAVELLQLRCRV